jgi:hypothetical protein
MDDDSWTCGDCGWTNAGGRFCFECGRDGNPEPPTVQRLAPEPDDDRLPWRRLALIGGAIALLVVIAAGVAVLLSGGDGTAPAAKARPAPRPAVRPAPVKLTRGETLDELMKIVTASRAGLAATRKGEWAQAAENRRGLVGRLDVLATRTDQIEQARAGLASALVASERANKKSLACKDRARVSACAAPAHQRATVLKERFRRTFNKILVAAHRAPVAPSSF